MSKKRGGGMPGGFDLGNFGALLQQAQAQAEQLKQKMEQELRDKTVEGDAGGGMVKVTLTGNLEVRRFSLDPSVLDPKEKDMLEDLLAAAMNVALKKAKGLQEQAQQGELSNIMKGAGGGGGGMPDISKLLGGL